MTQGDDARGRREGGNAKGRREGRTRGDVVASSQGITTTTFHHHIHHTTPHNHHHPPHLNHHHHPPSTTHLNHHHTSSTPATNARTRGCEARDGGQGTRDGGEGGHDGGRETGAQNGRTRDGDARRGGREDARFASSRPPRLASLLHIIIYIIIIYLIYDYYLLPDPLPGHPSCKPDPSDSGPGCQIGSGRVHELAPGPDPNRTLANTDSESDSIPDHIVLVVRCRESEHWEISCGTWTQKSKNIQLTFF